MSARSKREKFEKLAEKRTTDIIHKMRLLGNLSNRSNYDYEPDHVKQILSAIDAELKGLKKRFEDTDDEGRPSFSFKTTKKGKSKE